MGTQKMHSTLCLSVTRACNAAVTTELMGTTVTTDLILKETVDKCYSLTHNYEKQLTNATVQHIHYDKQLTNVTVQQWLHRKTLTKATGQH